MRQDFVPGVVSIPGGTASIGSTIEEVELCVSNWSNRLVDATYTEAMFRSWILKEYPQYPIEIRPYLIGQFPVTNGQYKMFLTENSAAIPESIAHDEPHDHPVWGVSYNDAVSYCSWLSIKTDTVFRLPTEAEWEYAARGNSRCDFPFGDTFDARKCNTVEAGPGHTTPVDFYPSGASQFGVWDMAGNVEEWTSDTYRPYPGGTVIEDYLFQTLGPDYRILRGGCLTRGGDLARCARRHGPLPIEEFRFTGFRVVQEIARTEPAP